MEIGIENKYVDTGAQRINPISQLPRQNPRSGSL